MATPAATPPSEAAPTTTTITSTSKPIHSLVLDTGPLIKNDPSVSALLARAEQLYTLPSVVAEIRDAATRSRVETQLLPFVTVRSPHPRSVAVVREFARRTGDLGSLSGADVEVLALAYDLECERNGGDWRLRSDPDQKRVNGRPPQREEEAAAAEEGGEGEKAATQEEEGEKAVGVPVVSSAELPVEEMAKLAVADSARSEDAPEAVDARLEGSTEVTDTKPEGASDAAIATQNEDTTESEPPAGAEAAIATQNEDTTKSEPPAGAEAALATQNKDTTKSESLAETETATEHADAQDGANLDDGLVLDEIVEEADDDDGEASDDDGGWITPSNIKKHKAQAGGSTPSQTPQRTLQAAVLTSDFAMQNVALRMNLNLVTPSFARITQLKTWVLRCHGCFAVTRQTERQFCPRCGQPTLLRASCSTDAQGVARLHLKTRGFQYNNRGNVYSVPKPVHGSPHGRLARGAGGKNNWGAGLLLAEDQKEYVRATEARRRQTKRDLMDEEYLPGILTGDRAGGGKIKVGAGRSVNARRRR